MLLRRGFRPSLVRPDLPFPPDLDGEKAETLCSRLGHYGFRLFLRGAIQRTEGFAHVEATRYLTPTQSKAHAEALVDLGLYLELKSSPPKHLSGAEIAAFFGRLDALRPHIALFVMDTALRLSDKVVPMLLAEHAVRRGGPPAKPRRVERELWALTPHLYAVNAKPDLLVNVGHAVAEGLRALSPSP